MKPSRNIITKGMEVYLNKVLWLKAEAEYMKSVCSKILIIFNTKLFSTRSTGARWMDGGLRTTQT